MQDNYDPHKDIDTLEMSCPAGPRMQALHRIRNWIDEEKWNNGETVSHPLDREIPFGARGEAVNRTDNDLREAIARLQAINASQLTSLEDWAERCEKVRSILNVQKDPGNRNANEHMYGMYVALELAMSILDKRDVAWLPYEGDSRVTLFDRAATVVADAERQMNDVRNKNTELEISNRTLIEQRKVLLSRIGDWERKSIEHDARVDEAYKRGVREGKTEARTEYLHGFTDGTAYNPNDKAFTSD